VEQARPADPADLEVVAGLLSTALDHVRTVRGGMALAGPATPEELIRRWTPPGGDVALYVGVFHHAVVGLAAASVFHRAGAPVPSGRIECVYVEAEARGVGVGTALMDAMVAWCAAQGCGDVDALALPGDRPSKQRLEAAGFTARLLTLNRLLR
jgi:GNAT superfamily N-acetyltransferase